MIPEDMWEDLEYEREGGGKEGEQADYRDDSAFKINDLKAIVMRLGNSNRYI